jgi:hypothetical protein
MPSVALYHGIYVSNKFIFPDNTVSNEYIQKRTNEEKSLIASEFGLGMQLQKKFFTFSCGLSHYKYGEKIAYSNEIYAPQITQTKFIDKINQNEYWNVTSHSVFILTDNNYWSTRDSVFTYWNGFGYETDTFALQQYVVNNIDTVQLTFYDSLLIVQTDTVYTYKTDTTLVLTTDETIKNYHQNNIYSYFEVNFSTGIKIPYKRFTVGLNVGAGLSFLNKTNVVYINKEMTEIYKVENYKKTSITGITSIPLEYMIDERISLYVAPYLRMQFTSPLTEQHFSQYYYSMGLQYGLRFRF